MNNLAAASCCMLKTSMSQAEMLGKQLKLPLILRRLEICLPEIQRLLLFGFWYYLGMTVSFSYSTHHPASEIRHNQEK